MSAGSFDVDPTTVRRQTNVESEANLDKFPNLPKLGPPQATHSYLRHTGSIKLSLQLVPENIVLSRLPAARPRRKFLSSLYTTDGAPACRRLTAHEMYIPGSETFHPTKL
ncbi:hypothetical protein BaRGS_00016867 [Batillaria attramentaria]|uniref:Uncharacterized protein n=1 Tax=Batillaria attramentaria TaxID=370345 RepID=A0ABD0KXG2_9CAEN